MHRPTAILATTALGVSALTGGCGTPAGVLLSPPAGAPVFPGPPDEPRVRYLGSFSTEADLLPARGGFENLGRALFGEEAPRGMMTPLAVAADADRLFIPDSNEKVVHVLNLATREYQAWAPPAPGFDVPVAAAVAPDGRVVVSDSAAGRVHVFTPSGAYVGAVGEGVLERPCGLAFDRAGVLYVADSAAHQVVGLDRAGREVKRLGHRGWRLGEFNYPTNLVFDGQGRLYVSDTLNFRVQLFDAGLNAVRQIGSKGDLPGYFSQPKGVAVDPDDNLWVVDANFEAVQLFDRDGGLLMSFGEEGRGPGQFWLPAGMHIDQLGRVFIADSYNQRVQVFQYLREGARP